MAKAASFGRGSDKAVDGGTFANIVISTRSW